MVGVRYRWDPRYIEQFTDRLIEELDGSEYIENLKGLFKQYGDHVTKLADRIDDAVKRIERLENTFLPAGRDREQGPRYTPVDADLYSRVVYNFPRQYLGKVEPGTEEMERCASGEATKFMLWGVDDGPNGWLCNLQKIVGSRRFWLRRLTWKDLTVPGVESDRPIFIVVRLLYEK